MKVKTMLALSLYLLTACSAPVSQATAIVVVETHVASTAQVVEQLEPPVVPVSTPFPPEVISLDKITPAEITGWDILYSGPLYPDSTDFSLRHYPEVSLAASFMQLWMKEDSLIWATVYQFSSSAKEAFASWVGSLTTNPSLISTISEGLVVKDEQDNQLWAMQRGHWILMVGGALLITDTRFTENDLVFNLFSQAVKNLPNSQGNRQPGSSGYSRIGYLAGPWQPGKLAAGVLLQASNDSRITFTIPIQRNPEGKELPNGSVKLELVISKQTAKKFIVKLYLKSITVGKENGDDEFSRGGGDIFVAGKLTYAGVDFPFITGELDDSFDENETKEFNMLLVDQTLELDQTATGKAEVKIRVRDNDTGDVFDALKSHLEDVYKFVTGDKARRIRILLDQLNKIESETIKKPAVLSGNVDYYKYAESIRGDPIGDGESKNINLPLPKD